jgi:hypothetical protein
MTTSECPLIYFVTECTTISAPSFKGVYNINLSIITWKQGDMNVLSTTRIMPGKECTIFATFSISTSFNVGFAKILMF